MCEELNSVPALFIHLAQLHLIFYWLEVKKEPEPVGEHKGKLLQIYQKSNDIWLHF